MRVRFVLKSNLYRCKLRGNASWAFTSHPTPQVQNIWDRRASEKIIFIMNHIGAVTDHFKTVLKVKSSQCQNNSQIKDSDKPNSKYTSVVSKSINMICEVKIHLKDKLLYFSKWKKSFVTRLMQHLHWWLQVHRQCLLQGDRLGPFACKGTLHSIK